MTADFVHVFWSEEDRCYVADIPELFPCAAYAETEGEALELLGVVMEAWLDAAEQWKMGLPAEAERRAQVLLRE